MRPQRSAQNVSGPDGNLATALDDTAIFIGSGKIAIRSVFRFGKLTDRDSPTQR